MRLNNVLPSSIALAVSKMTYTVSSGTLNCSIPSSIVLHVYPCIASAAFLA